jgi:hypothetical protein
VDGVAPIRLGQRSLLTDAPKIVVAPIEAIGPGQQGLAAAAGAPIGFLVAIQHIDIAGGVAAEAAAHLDDNRSLVPADEQGLAS